MCEHQFDPNIIGGPCLICGKPLASIFERELGYRLVKGLESAALAEERRRVAEIVAPIAHFIAMLDAQPLRGGADAFYGIHMGTEWAAELRISDLRKIAALAAPSAADKTKGAE